MSWRTRGAGKDALPEGKGQVNYTMAITKLPDGRWQVRVDVGRKPDGGRHRPTRICSTKREAQAVEADLLAQKAVNDGTSGRVRLDWFARTMWLPEKEPICTYDTYRNYKSHLENHILPALGHMYLSDIRHTHVQRMISGCSSEKVAKNARATLRNVLQMALDLGAIKSNPASSRSFRYPRKVKKGRTNHGEWLTDFASHRELIEAARGQRIFPVVVLGLCFGLRKDEILGMDWEQVDFERGCIRVVQAYVNGPNGKCVIKEPKTESSVREIPMTAFARELLEEMAPDDQSGPVCLSSRLHRLTPDYANELMRKFVRKHDVPQVTILSLRHSFATSCVRAGINVVSVSKWLGHASVATTLNKYVRPLQQDLRTDVADVIDTLYRKGPADIARVA